MSLEEENKTLRTMVKTKSTIIVLGPQEAIDRIDNPHKALVAHDLSVYQAKASQALLMAGTGLATVFWFSILVHPPAWALLVAILAQQLFGAATCQVLVHLQKNTLTEALK